MSSTLDPYQAWLNLPEGERPPNHYQLLGLNPFEEDAAAIRAGADARLEAVRPHTQGPNQALAQQLIDEIGDARVCLLSPPDKWQYDEKLRKQPQAAPVAVPVEGADAPATQPAKSARPLAAVPLAAQPVDDAADDAADDPDSETEPASAAEPAAVQMRRFSLKNKLSTPVVVVSVLAALGIIVLAFVLFSGDPQETAENSSDDKSETKGDDRDEKDKKDRSGGDAKKKPAPRKLALAPVAPQVTGPGEPILVEARIADDEKPSGRVTFKLTGKAPQGAAIDRNTGRLTWRPTSKHAGKEFRFKIIATAGDTTAEQLVAVQVEPNDPPPQLARVEPKPEPPKDPVDPPDPKPEPKPAPREPQPLPDVEQLATAMKLADQVYSEQITDATTKEDRIDLAQKMMLTATGSPAGSADRYVLMTKAVDLIGSTGDARETVTAVDQLAKEFEVDAIEEKIRQLDKVYIARGSKTTEGSKQLSLEAIRLANDAFESDRFDNAIAALRLANTAARRADNNELSRLALVRKREIEKLEERYAPVKKAQEVLAEKPDDANANLYVGRWTAFVHGDWKAGLPMLAKGSNSLLKKLADDELADPGNADAKVALADRWWDLAEKGEGTMRDQIRKHAVDWYKQALPNLSGLSAKVVQQRIDTFEQSEESSEVKPKEPAE